jgi:hypothetical protein
MWQIGEPFKQLGGYFFLTLLIVGIITMWSIPIHAATVTITVDCEKVVGKPGEVKPGENCTETDEVRCPGGCPPNLPLAPGPPPAGAIQVNPINNTLPSGAMCGEDMAHNKCSQQGYSCSLGKLCKDTWNKVTKACMCKCM